MGGMTFEQLTGTGLSLPHSARYSPAHGPINPNRIPRGAIYHISSRKNVGLAIYQHDKYR